MSFKKNWKKNSNFGCGHGAERALLFFAKIYLSGDSLAGQ